MLAPKSLEGVATMTSRLYPTTRRLFGQVFRALQALGLGAVLSPMAFALTAIYVSGLILLDRRQNNTRMADWLPARAHDALNRLLRTESFSSRMVMGAVRNWASRLGRGYLALDDVVATKPFSCRNARIGWTYSTAERRKVRGYHVVALIPISPISGGDFVHCVHFFSCFGTWIAQGLHWKKKPPEKAGFNPHIWGMRG